MPADPTTGTEREFYAGVSGSLYAVHYNGSVYAIFSGANQALAYWRGLDERSREYFRIENADGEKVTLHDQPRAPGHAYAILAALDRSVTPDDSSTAPSDREGGRP